MTVTDSHAVNETIFPPSTRHAGPTHLIQRGTLVSHYAGTNPHRAADERLAACHRHDPQLEEFLSWWETDPPRFASLPSSTRLALGHYQATKAAAERVARTAGPTA